MTELKNQLFRLSAERAVHTVWIMSDLQQTEYQVAENCLRGAVEDFKRLGVRPEQIWNLGDATQCGTDADAARRMMAMECGYLNAFGVPVCFVMGNHDLDYDWKVPSGTAVLPGWTEARKHGWITTSAPDDFYFRQELGDEYVVYFFSDHMAPDGSWISRHGGVRGEGYPYGDDFYNALRAKMAGETRRVITAAHYGMAGCNRPSATLSRLMPLPGNVRMHLYGHAHITDLDVCYESAFKRMQWLDWHDIPAFDVASIENTGAAYCRSVILHLYADGSAGVFWRNHDSHRFEECMFPSEENRKEGLSAYLSTHPDFRWY